MAETTRAFFIGVGTTVIVASMAFGGGLFFAKHIMEQPASAFSRRTEASQLPPARVILPASAEIARSTEATAAPPQLTISAVVPQTTAAQESEPKLASTPESQPTPERDKAAEHAERRKAEAEQRERHRRAAARKARQEAVRQAKLQQRQEQREPRIMAFGGDSDQPLQKSSDLFGN